LDPQDRQSWRVARGTWRGVEGSPTLQAGPRAACWA